RSRRDWSSDVCSSDLSVILLQLPNTQQAGAILTGSIVAVLALTTSTGSLYALQKVLDAPARSETELELAWDDAERADSLRQVARSEERRVGIERGCGL